jgi:hypothetical protein
MSRLNSLFLKFCHKDGGEVAGGERGDLEKVRAWFLMKMGGRSFFSMGCQDERGRSEGRLGY